MGGCKQDWVRLFSAVPSDRASDNQQKLKYRGSCLNTRKHFFAVQVTKHWHRWPREAVESPSFERLKAIWMQSLATCSSWPCLTRLAGPDGLQWCLPIWMFLWLCAFQQNSFSHNIGLMQVYTATSITFETCILQDFQLSLLSYKKLYIRTYTLCIHFVFSTEQ